MTESLRVSVIVPTYREAENLPALIDQIDRVRSVTGWDLEVHIMDDRSNDGTVDVVRQLCRDWVHLHVRHGKRGLSSAVIDGFAAAGGDILIVMDADLSHPPEKLPDLVAALEAGADFVIGSRYTPGGTTDAAWGPLRALNSRFATWLARPFTQSADPMAGFFALRRAALGTAAALNPIGYKIGLELIVKCGFEQIVEVPIDFRERRLGQSKLTLWEQLRYLEHVRRLFDYRYGTWSYLAQFTAVGASGVVVNLVVLTVLLAFGVPFTAATAVAIVSAMLSNFALNRRFSFSYARGGTWWQQLAGFVGACSLGALVNWGVTLATKAALPGVWPQVAALVGIAAGMGFNFALCRWWVFRARPAAACATPR